MFALATEAGLLVVTAAGEVTSRSLEDSKLRSATPLGGAFAAALEGRGVYVGSGDDWHPAGLESAIIWTLRAADPVLYAGVEPAAIWRREPSGSWTELSGLDLVEGRPDWHSPWGPPDLCSIVAEPGRLIAGIEVGGVAISDDVGLTWRAANDGLFEDVHAVAADGQYLFAATGGGLHRSIDGGDSWSWQAEGIDRGYTQGLAISDGYVLVSAASGPPPLWESGGPEAAIFRAKIGDAAPAFTIVMDRFEGNVPRQGIVASGSLVGAGTSAGEFIVSTDGGANFEVVATGLPGINGVAFIG